MTDVSVGFRPPFWCPSRWAPVWRLHTNLYKFGSNVFPHIFDEKNCCDLNLGESDCIFTGFFLFSDSGLYLFNGFNFYFNLFQEPITRSLQQPHIPVTAFSQTDLFLVWIYLEFRSPREPQWPIAITSTDYRRHVYERPHCFNLTEACSCGLVLAYFARKISKNILVCKNAVSVAYCGSCRLLVMGSCLFEWCDTENQRYIRNVHGSQGVWDTCVFTRDGICWNILI